MAEVNFSEIPFGISVDPKQDLIFNLIDEPSRFLPYENTFQNSVTFEIGEALKVITRLDYGILDWLSDIGGLYKILQIGAFILISNLIEDGPTLYLTTTMISRTEDRMHQRREFTDKSKALTARP